MAVASAVTVTVESTIAALNMRVVDIAMGLTLANNGSAEATATVKMLHAVGQLVGGAALAGSWSGLVKCSDKAAA